MPELPEVEVTRRALAPALEGKRLTKGRFYCEKLRHPVPDMTGLAGAELVSLSRRAKYLIWHFVRADGTSRYLLTHLGMSGSWRLWPTAELPPAGAHDRADFVFGDVVARLTDTRKFSDIVLTDREPETVPPLSELGVEPFTEAFTAEILYKGLQTTHRAVKPVLLEGKIVVGCGNIYANESCFEAGISPKRPADQVTRQEAVRLQAAVKDVLTRAVAAGGTTLRDFHGADGKTGWFSLQCAVYGREGQTCPRCGCEIRRVMQCGRSTFFCPGCQK